ncbi:MAG: aldose epimerase family protein [Dysgonomonas sp.]
MVEKKNFEKIVDGKQTNLYTLNNKNGVKISVTNFGARVIELYVPDRNGNYDDIVLGYDHIDKYLNNTGERFLGAVCGRYANRIANGTFEIEGKVYHLPINNNGQTLHGGIKGLDSVVWDIVSSSNSKILFRYVSPDMEEGFPGTLTITMTYELNDEDEFRITYNAATNQATHINLTHHSFFNFHGEGKGHINDHILQINADQFIPVDEVSIPLGVYKSVQNTPMNFLRPNAIGSRLTEPYPQLKLAGGYDHNWILSETKRETIELAATVYEPISGRYMEVWTDQPGIQFYGGNFFDGKTASKDGRGVYSHQGAFALETQHFPDTPNQKNFPSTLLYPNEEYKHICVYKFSVKG